MKIFFYSTLLAFYCIQSQAKLEGAYYHDSAPLPKQIWMKKLPDSRELNKISIPGTHDTASFYGGDMTQTQSLSVAEQLNAGIRFLDIRIWHDGTKFHIYHGIAYQHQDFGQIMKDVTNFLNTNPSEVVLMRVSQTAEGKGNFNNTFNDYVKPYKKFMAYPQGNYNPRLCQVRGKILLFPTDNIPILQQWGLDYNKAFDAQDDYHLTTNWDLNKKWEKIRAQIDKANANINSKDRKIYMNYISGSGGSFPYFVASGQSRPATGAAQLAGFPKGTNEFTMDYLHDNRAKLKYVGIVIADFPGKGLIQSIIDINDFNFSPSLQDVQGACPKALEAP